MKNSYGVHGIAAVFATLLISIIGAQGQVLAEEKAWVVEERTLPAPAAASEALRDAIAICARPALLPISTSMKGSRMGNT